MEWKRKGIPFLFGALGADSGIRIPSDARIQVEALITYAPYYR
jgi:hypothetical protein